MKEKFSNFDGEDFLKSEGEFQFTIKEAIKQSNSAGDGEIVKFVCVAPEGKTDLYKSLKPEARWSYNQLIRAALQISKEDWKDFEGDYDTIHTQLIGKTFNATVVASSYTKTRKVERPDGTFETKEEEKVSYKIADILE